MDSHVVWVGKWGKNRWDFFENVPSFESFLFFLRSCELRREPIIESNTQIDLAAHSMKALGSKGYTA